LECSKAGTPTAEHSRRVTDLAVAALAEAGVIRPWQIKLKSGAGEQPVGGLHCIDGAAPNGLADDIFLKVRRTSVLFLADAQILSTGRLGIFRAACKVLQPTDTTASRDIAQNHR
jgi:hypothetical protein